VSPDSSLIAFAWRDSTSTPHVAVLNLGRGVTTPQGPAGRNNPGFANQNNLWYAGEGACGDCMGGFGPSGKTYLFDLSAQSEVSSRIANLIDVWPRST
jgi:hypothetical protein